MKRVFTLLASMFIAVLVSGCAIDYSSRGYVVRPAPVRFYIDPLWYDYPYYSRSGLYSYSHPYTRVIVYKTKVKLVKPHRHDNRQYDWYRNHRHTPAPQPPPRNWVNPRRPPPHNTRPVWPPRSRHNTAPPPPESKQPEVRPPKNPPPVVPPPDKKKRHRKHED